MFNKETKSTERSNSKGIKLIKLGVVIFGAIVITALGIDAADTLSGKNGTMLGQLIATEEGGCPQGMIAVLVGQTFSCVDIYEASPGDDCPLSVLTNDGATQENINELDCEAVSVRGGDPWTYITREQARVMCLRSGKRLPTASEWYTFAAGTPDTKGSCVTAGSVRSSGDKENCVSSAGVFDAIGNVWEWVSDDIFDGTFNNRPLPEDGYVTQVASDGVATVSSENTPDEAFGADYVWSESEGVYGMLRGGFYGSGEDAGVYAVQAKTAPTDATVAIGFRCVL